MQSIDWRPFMAMDNGDWDDGRRELLNQINQLTDQSIARDQTAVAGLVDGLAAAAARQFAREDEAMAAESYPLRARHAAKHRRILGQIDFWRRRVAEEWRMGAGANLFLTIGPLVFRHLCDDDLTLLQHRRWAATFWRRAA